FVQAEDGIRDPLVTGVQTCALPIWRRRPRTTRGTAGGRPRRGPPGRRRPPAGRAVHRAGRRRGSRSGSRRSAGGWAASAASPFRDRQSVVEGESVGRVGGGGGERGG